MLIGLAAYKHHCAIWFHHGVFLADVLPDKAQRLRNAQDSTRGMRQWRLERGDELDVALFRTYVDATIANEQAGKRLKPKAPASGAPTQVPEELAALLQADTALAEAFAGLTPGRQREYVNHVASAKRAETRSTRADKSAALIRLGVGLHDKYRSG